MPKREYATAPKRAEKLLVCPDPSGKFELIREDMKRATKVQISYSCMKLEDLQQCIWNNCVLEKYIRTLHEFQTDRFKLIIPHDLVQTSMEIFTRAARASVLSTRNSTNSDPGEHHSLLPSNQCYPTSKNSLFHQQHSMDGQP